MAAKYTAKEVREAKAAGQTMATIDVAGLCFSGAVCEAEQRELVEFYLSFTARRGERLKADAAKTGG